VVPNVFDFDQPQWKRDEFNADFKQAMGLEVDDIVFMQATRVMSRKGIELAIDVVGEIGKAENRKKLEAQPLYDGRSFTFKNKIVLLCVGHVEEFGSAADYTSRLQKRAEAQGVDLRFVGTSIDHSRASTATGKRYSLWDSYCFADIVTYPSWWEGWGNQFIEAIFAKLPVVIYEYPVFVSDLKNDGFKVVSLGDSLSSRDDLDLVTVERRTIEKAAEEAIALLQNSDLRKSYTETNFAIAKEKYSYVALTNIIQKLLENACVETGGNGVGNIL
jgi:glycosyltransferase involved in cell wall biosynthesis